MRSPGEGPLPPRVLEALVRLAVPDDPVGASILGDLREEFRERVEAESRSSAVRWYGRHALGVSIRVGGGRAWAVIPSIAGGGGIDGWIQDVRFAARSFVRHPGFTGRRETGIRMALGARRDRVVLALAGRGMQPTVVGAALGLLGAWGLTRLLTTFLFDVTPLEPVIVSGALAVLLAAGSFAAYFPARRASRIEPATVLRED